MDIKFSKDSGGSHPQEAPGEKKNQRALLLLLLILVGGFAYLYFFTDLIKPMEVQKTAEPPVAAPQIIKMPLPSRESDPAQQGTKAQVKPVPPPAAKPVPAPAVKPVPAPAKLKDEPKKIATAKPSGIKLQPVPVKDKATHKAAITKVAEKKTAAKAKSSSANSWSLTAGNYVLEEAMSADMAHIRKAGFVPTIKPAARKRTTMSRLFVSEFDDRAAAKSTLEKLKRYTSDAFIIEQDRKFAVYAGSYLQAEAVNSEQKRLKGAGIATIVRHAEIAIPSNSLSIGPFKSKNAADAAINRLKKAGIKATLSQK
ncbi:MAG: SPOR domain-containing protein [Deltaproteobacteria bacterium]|jgi:cell division septation protein DedD|nr:SPOR domain-containing protein [Deltaproteobacteria bacterium]